MDVFFPSEIETPSTSDMVTLALAYNKQKWPVLPIHTIAADGVCTCRNERCSSPGKHPRTKNGVKDATKDYETVRAWWKRDPDANIGIATGSGLLVIDIVPLHRLVYGFLPLISHPQ